MGEKEEVGIPEKREECENDNQHHEFHYNYDSGLRNIVAILEVNPGVNPYWYPMIKFFEKVPETMDFMRRNHLY